MFFKKKKIAAIHEKKLRTSYVLGVFGVIIILYFGIYVVQAMNNINFKVFDSIGPSNILNFSGDLTSEEQSENKDIIYILLTGRGGGTHDAPDLTDTIILVGIHPTKKTITLFSIPRDLYVQYPGVSKKGKINKVYETFLSYGKSDAMERLKTKVSEITGKEINFYVNLDFKGFIEIVDTLGGVEVTLENNFVDYEYPDGKLGYKTFILRKGTWTLDGEVALMYARSRHSSSDFDRSLRQQEIISSLREKISNFGYFKDRKQIVKLYNIFKDYVETDMTLSDMVNVGLTIKSWDTSQTLSFNLNDSCYEGSPTCTTGGFLYVPLREYFGGSSVLLPDDANVNNLSNYDVIHTYTDYIYKQSEIYTSKKNIVIYNATKTSGLAGDLSSILKPYGFAIDPLQGVQTLRNKKFEKSILYYNGIDSQNSTLIALQDFLNIEMQKTDMPLYSPTGTNIEIIIADTTSF